jgi:hypothetical protein
MLPSPSPVDRPAALPSSLTRAAGVDDNRGRRWTNRRESTLPDPAAVFHTAWVESECGAVAVGRTYRLPPLSFGGALLVRPWLRFHIPLIEPDMQISRIRLSDKTSRLHRRFIFAKALSSIHQSLGNS